MKQILTILAAAVILFLAAGPVTAAPGVGDKLSISITNKYGDVFTNLTVVQILGDGLVLGHSMVQMKVKYESLPQAVREKYQPLAGATVEKEQGKGALNAAYIAREQQLQIQQAQQLAAQKEQENEQANDRQPMENLQYLIIGIPDVDWRITIINPGLAALKRHVETNRFILSGLPGPNGFNLTIVVEKPANGYMSNEAVFNYYWSTVANSPAIDAGSVEVKKEGKFIRVSYTLQGVPNVNYFFAFKDRWVDVHVSKWPFEKTDSKLFADFEEHLSYGE
jgi:hypothetical protein